MIKLLEYRRNDYQNYGYRECPYYGEDGVILKIFEEIGVSSDPTCVEFGELRVLGTTTRAYRIFYKARSLYFSFSYDFRSFYLNIIDVFKVIFITGSLKYLKFLLNFPFKEYVTTSNIENIFQKNNIKKDDLDLLTVDLDSSDYYIVKKLLDLDYRPKLFIVEYNPSFGLTRKCTVPEGEDLISSSPRLYGASFQAMDSLMTNNNYSLCHVTGFCNLHYIRSEYADKFEKPNIEVEFTDTEEKISKYLNDYCQEGFIPSWMNVRELSDKDFLKLNHLS